MMNILKKIYKWLVSLFKPYCKPYKVVFANDIPDSISVEKIYIIGEDGYYWCIVFKCPCGCDKTICLNLIKSQNPTWSYEVHADKTVSLHPSIWGKTGCKSHFFIKRGLVEWCNEYLETIKNI